MTLVFDAVHVHFGTFKQRFRLWDTSDELCFLINLGVRSSDCVQINGLTVAKIKREARFPIPYSAVATRNGVPLSNSDLVEPGDVVEFVDSLLFDTSKASPGHSGEVSSNAAPAAKATIMPRWNDDKRSLSVGDQLIKSLTKPAPLQTLVLRAFQELGWPARIDDPLKAGQRDYTVASLNRNHKNPGIIQFGKDGTGRGIKWQLVK